MRRIAMLVPALVLALLAWAPTAEGAITCHQTATPTGSITTAQGLVNALSTGQTGCFRAGTYVGDVTVSKQVTLTSYGGEAVTLRGRVLITGAGARLEKLLLDGRNAGNLASPVINASDVVLRDNDITNVNTAASCIATVTSGALVPDRFLIERNRIHHCGALPATNTHQALSLEQGANGIVRDNVVYDNANRGIQLWPSLSGAQVGTNTIDGNGQGVLFGGAAASNAVTNNLITNATIRWNLEDSGLTGTGNSASGNCVFGSNANTYYNGNGGIAIAEGFATRVSLGTGNTIGNPLFVNRAAKDFTLQSTTPCSGKGAPAAVAGLAPDTTIEAGPSGTTSSTAATFDFSSNRPGVTFQCSLDGAAYTACSGPKAYTVGVGAHTFAVRAQLGSVVDPSPATRTWTVTGVPDTTITGGPSGLTNSASPSFTFTSTISGSTFECRLDTPAGTGTFSACTSPKAYSGLAQGAHTFHVRATASGQTDASPATRTFTVDTVAPDTTITSGPSGTITATSATFGFSSETGATFECRLDTPAGTGTFSACTSPKAYTGLAQGAHTFHVRARDAAANTDATPATRAFTVSGCSQTAAPGADLNAFITGLAAGQTGCLQAGTYGVPSVRPRFYNDNVTLRSVPGQIATVRGRLEVMTGADGVRIESLRMQVNAHRQSNGDIESVGIIVSGNDFVLRNVDIGAVADDPATTNVNENNIICVNTGETATPLNLLIERNRIHDCGGSAPYTNQTHGVYIQGGTGIVRENVIYDNMARGIQLRGTAQSIQVVNNTIDGNGQGGSFGDQTTNSAISNNVISNSDNRWNLEDYNLTGTGNVAQGNCLLATNANTYYNGSGGISIAEGFATRVSLGSGNPIADPQYVNRGAKDFRVQNATCTAKAAPASVANPVGFPVP